MALILMLTNWGSEDRKVTVYCLEALGVRLLWVSRVVPDDGDKTVAVMVILLGMAAIPSKEVRVISLGYLVAVALLTVMDTEAVVDWFPALSRAIAVRL